MGQTDPGLVRLKFVLIMFVFVLIFNVMVMVFLDNDAPYDKVADTTKYEGDEYPDSSVTDIIGTINTVFKFVAFFFGGFLIFNVPGLPFYITVFVVPIYIFSLIAFWYMVVDYIKDITILGSHL